MCDFLFLQILYQKIILSILKIWTYICYRIILKKIVRIHIVLLKNIVLLKKDKKPNQYYYERAENYYYLQHNILQDILNMKIFHTTRFNFRETLEKQRSKMFIIIRQ